MKLSERILKAIDRLEDEQISKFTKFVEDLSREAMNTRCDLSAIDPGHHVGFKHGHKQARHEISEMILLKVGDFIERLG